MFLGVLVLGFDLVVFLCGIFLILGLGLGDFYFSVRVFFDRSLGLIIRSIEVYRFLGFVRVFFGLGLFVVVF